MGMVVILLCVALYYRFIINTVVILSTDPSLTLENLESCLKDVRVDGLATYFDIPSSKQDEFLSKLKNTDTRKHSHLAYWLDNHPVPSWIIIVDSLWMAGEYKAHEQVLERFYLKG